MTFRCDTCNAGLTSECWEWLTPSNATLEEATAAVAADIPGAFHAEDPRWALCAKCNALMEQYEAGLLSDVEVALWLCNRSLSHQQMLAFGFDEAELDRMAELQRKHVMETIVAFVKYHVPEHRREVLA